MIYTRYADRRLKVLAIALLKIGLAALPNNSLLKEAES